MGQTLQVADLLPGGRGFLESGGGAGLFGFLINPPIALYYMQGLNITPVQAHTALFGVYGMLGQGLMLLSLRILTVRRQWRTGALAFSFWAMQIGLGLMILLSLLPIGLAQTRASVEHGMWCPVGGIPAAGTLANLPRAPGNWRHALRRRRLTG